MSENAKNSYNNTLLAQKLVNTLVELNTNTSVALWESEPDVTKRVLRFDQESTVLKIINILGQDLFDYLMDLRPTIPGATFDICIREFKQINFKAFVAVANQEIAVRLGIYDDVVSVLPNYEEAWTLLEGLARFMDNFDPVIFTPNKFIPGMVSVQLVQGTRVFLFKIMQVAELQSVVSDAVYHDDVYFKTPIKPQQVCTEMDFEEFCVDINAIESFIRSMTDNWHMFTFDIEELATTDNPRTKMTLVDFLRHECKVYENERENLEV